MLGIVFTSSEELLPQLQSGSSFKISKEIKVSCHRQTVAGGERNGGCLSGRGHLDLGGCWPLGEMKMNTVGALPLLPVDLIL